MTPESADDFTWEENKAFADIICSGLTAEDIEFLEGFANGVWDDEE